MNIGDKYYILQYSSRPFTVINTEPPSFKCESGDLTVTLSGRGDKTMWIRANCIPILYTAHKCDKCERTKLTI